MNSWPSPSASAAAYAPAVAEGRALLVVRAPFAPVGTARHAIKTVNRYPALSVGLEDEDVYIREDPKVKDLLYNVQYPPSGGFTNAQLTNIGQLDANGLEIGVKGFDGSNWTSLVTVGLILPSA